MSSLVNFESYEAHIFGVDCIWDRHEEAPQLGRLFDNPEAEGLRVEDWQRKIEDAMPEEVIFEQGALLVDKYSNEVYSRGGHGVEAFCRDQSVGQWEGPFLWTVEGVPEKKVFIPWHARRGLRG